MHARRSATAPHRSAAPVACLAGHHRRLEPFQRVQREHRVVTASARHLVEDELQQAFPHTAAAAAAVVVCLAAGPAHAESLVGVPKIVDGDTLEVAGTRVRFYGVDAPESKQLCTDKGGKEYTCGLAAADALRKHVGSAPVRCDVKNRDQYNRAVAVCYRNGDEDLNEWMAANGQAVAYTEYSKDYAASADVARRKKAGIWSGAFEYPADWRKDNKASTSKHRFYSADDNLEAPKLGATAAATSISQASAPAPARMAALPPDKACPIKGNINSRGERIYHVPGGRSYDATVVDVASGEQWFCSSVDAERAGFRAAKS